MITKKNKMQVFGEKGRPECSYRKTSWSKIENKLKPHWFSFSFLFSLVLYS